MNVATLLTGEREAHIIKNMYPLYLHDLSEHYGGAAGHMPNRHGIFEDSDEYRTLQDQYDVQNVWWEKKDCLYPFLITVDDLPAGFVLIATPPHCSKGTDYFVHEFFVLRPFRGFGVAEQAAALSFDRFRGKWELFTNPAPKNVVAQRFWRRTVSNYTHGKYEEIQEHTFDGEKLVFRFTNSGSL